MELTIYETCDGEMWTEAHMYWEFIKSIDMCKEYYLWEKAIIKQHIDVKD